MSILDRARTVLGLRRASRSEPEAADRVDPLALLRQVRRLKFQNRPEALLELAGAYLGARPGTGLTFSELRAYEPGDDVRHLDWNVTARQGRPFVRRYVEERAMALWLVVDVSASMRFGPEGRSKADRAAQAAALLAAAAVQNGDFAGLLQVSERVETEIRPRAGMRHLSSLLRALVSAPVASGKTNLGAAFLPIRRSKRRTLVVVLSDFLEPGTAAEWQRLTRQHDVVGFRLVEPREEALPRSALLSLEEAETGRGRVVDAGSRRVREAYEAAARQRRERFRRFAIEAGLIGFALPTEEEPISALLRAFRELRGRRRARR